MSQRGHHVLLALAHLCPEHQFYNASSVIVHNLSPLICSLQLSLVRILTAICVADGAASFYRSTAEGLLFQALAPLLPEDRYSEKIQRLLQVQPLAEPNVPKGRQTYPSAPKKHHPVGLPIEKDRIRLQVGHDNDASTSQMSQKSVFSFSKKYHILHIWQYVSWDVLPRSCAA